MKLAIAEVLRGRHARAAPRPQEIAGLSSGPSTRVRILGWYVALLAIALILGLFLQRAVLRTELSGEVSQQLRQEVNELQQLSSGRNPQTGQPFGNDVQAIFDTFLRRNIPVQGEALFTLVDGKPYASTVTPLQLLDDPEVVANWAAVTSPVQAEIETEAGLVRYLAVPVLPDEGQRGVFVVAIFMDPEFADIDRVLQTGGVVFISVFVVASIIAWFAAGRILRPVRLLTETANSISESNWTQRIPVSGRDEIASLTRTFNAMLDRLQESFTTQRRFLDDAGHELRTPITIIRGHLEVMGDNPEEKEEVKLLVLDELERMSRIVDDLLLLARAEQAGFLDLRPLDVSELTDEIIAKAAGLGPPRPWLLEEKAYVVMRADRHRLTQALMNLVRNAVEHSPEGSEIAIGSREAGNQVQFWVRDRGEGIPADERERIFDRFVRGKVGHGPMDGAGLGLSIVKTIVESHGGTVRVNSKLGSGSTFTIVVPVAGPPDAR